MNTLIKVIIISALSLCSFAVCAQDFQGSATYKTKRKIEIELDSTQVNSEMHQRMIEMMKKQFEKTFILNFNREASVYKEDEKLASPQRGGMEMIVMTSDGSDILYRNFKENRFVSQNEVFGKVFLIKDSMPKLEWEMHSETKNIGEYTCFKATLKKLVPVVISGISVNGDKDFNEDENREPEMQEITIVVWYTPQIPVSMGPAKFYGLPGLILEVNDGQETIVCSKIVLNPKDKVTIDAPKQGKEISQKEYDEVVEKRMQEENERYEHRREGEGHSIEIRIGN